MLLRKVKVLAARLDIGQLDEWVEHELMGYPAGAQLPEYRGPFPAEVKGDFGGPFGSGIKNGPVPAVGFPKEQRDSALFKIEFRQSIAQLEEFSSSEDMLREEWPADAVAWTNSLLQEGKASLYPQMGLQQAWKPISPAHIRGIVDIVRTRILDLALSLEKMNPEAGQDDSQRIDTAQAQTIVTHIYGAGSNIAIGSSDVTQSVSLPPPGDLDGLVSYMRSLGVGTAQVDALLAAIDADGHEAHRSDLGQNVSAWLGRLVSHAGSFAANMSAGAAGELAAAALASYFGLPM